MLMGFAAHWTEAISLLSATVIAYGEVFNLNAEQVATSAAIARADKLLLLTEQDCVSSDGNLIRQLTTGEASPC